MCGVTDSPQIGYHITRKATTLTDETTRELAGVIEVYRERVY